MSLHPDPVEQLLERHGQHWCTAFVPPALEGMLAVATASPRHRTRWVWPLVAAAALLVIPLATVVGMHYSHKSPAPPVTHPPGLLGAADWSDAVLQADGRTLTIDVDMDRIPNICPDYGLLTTLTTRAVVSETATTVTITAQVFQPSHPSPTPSVPPGSPLLCSGVGYQAALAVMLSQPLGSRTLIDATTGHHHPVLRASTLLTPTYLPAGYVDQGIQWFEEVQQPQVLHDYTGPGGGELRVVRGYGFRAESDQQTLSTGTVLGHPAKIIRNTHLPARICVLWNDPEYSWSICSDSHKTGARLAPLDAAELLRIGNSMR